MRRVVVEWGVIFLTPLSLACLGYWAVSLASDRADFQLSFGERLVMQMGTADGAMTLCDRLSNVELIEMVEQGMMMTPTPSRRYQWVLPGGEFHYVGFGDGFTMWSVNFSLLIPAVLMMLVAGVCLVDYRRIRAAGRKAAKEAKVQRQKSGDKETRREGVRERGWKRVGGVE